MRLYEIPARLREAFEGLDVDPETGEILNAEALDEIEGEASEKVENTALYLRELKAESEALKVEAKRLLDRKASLDKRADYLRALLIPALDGLGGKVKTPRVTVYVSRRQAVEIGEGVTLPDEFKTIKVTETPNKTAIKAALLEGLTIEGVSLIETESVSMR